MVWPYRLVVALVVASSLLVATGDSLARPVPALPAGLPPPERAWLERIAGAAAVATHMASPPFSGRHGVFEYLIDHPEFATYVTRALRVARYRVWRTSAGLFLDDGWGVTGWFTVVYAGPGTRVMYARGHYEHALLPDIRGEAVVVLDFQARSAPPDRDVLSAAVTGFVKVDNSLLSLVARLATPAAVDKANLEAQRLLRVFARVSAAIETDPAGVYERVRSQPGVPQHELEDFGRLLNLR